MKKQRVKNMVDEGKDRDITLNWKPIEGYEGEYLRRYLISECGKVWDRKHDREVSQVLTGIPEYLYVNLQARCFEENGIGDGIWERAVVLGKDGMVDLIGAKKQVEGLNKKEWVVGDKTFFETFEGLCRVFGKDSGAVRVRMEKQGMLLEQALTGDPIRIKWYKVDGNLVLPSGEVVTYDKSKVKPVHLTTLLGVGHAYFNKRNKTTRDTGTTASDALLSTLTYFGCDVSSLSVAVEQR